MARMHHIPEEITNDLGELLSQLAALDFIPRASRYEPQSFGNYYVTLSRADGFLRIIRDRSKYCIDGERKELEPVGLWRAFDDREEFAKKLLSWVKGGLALQSQTR
jgi:hypothetical protein